MILCLNFPSSTQRQYRSIDAACEIIIIICIPKPKTNRYIGNRTLGKIKERASLAIPQRRASGRTRSAGAAGEFRYCDKLDISQCHVHISLPEQSVPLLESICTCPCLNNSGT